MYSQADQPAAPMGEPGEVETFGTRRWPRSNLWVYLPLALAAALVMVGADAMAGDSSSGSQSDAGFAAFMVGGACGLAAIAFWVIRWRRNGLDGVTAWFPGLTVIVLIRVSGRRAFDHSETAKWRPEDLLWPAVAFCVIIGFGLFADWRDARRRGETWPKRARSASHDEPGKPHSKRRADAAGRPGVAVALPPIVAAREWPASIVRAAGWSVLVVSAGLAAMPRNYRPFEEPIATISLLGMLLGLVACLVAMIWRWRLGRGWRVVSLPKDPFALRVVAAVAVWLALVLSWLVGSVVTSTPLVLVAGLLLAGGVVAAIVAGTRAGQQRRDEIFSSWPVV